ncbi:MAG TPA: hypothetical protein VJU79_09030 [Candidatus Dormibacteraeota bacterium]|nr:hypothetical protein [Candidatus Dormibacteraeota bacterium]
MLGRDGGGSTVSWWQVALIAAGAITAIVLVAGLRWRSELRMVIRIARALATDRRLPRPMRWMFAIALAIKTVPLPDLGVDEVLLVIAGLWLVIGHRRTFRAIVSESRAAGTAAQNPSAERARAKTTS